MCMQLSEHLASGRYKAKAEAGKAADPPCAENDWGMDLAALATVFPQATTWARHFRDHPKWGLKPAGGECSQQWPAALN